MWGYGRVIEIDVFQAMLFGHGPHHILFRGVTQNRQRLAHAVALVLGDLFSLIQLVRADDTASNQDLQKISHRCSFGLLAKLFASVVL